MSVKTNLITYKIPIKPSNQTTSSWSDMSTPITYLNKGTYNFTYNCMLQSSVGTLTSVLAIITRNALFPNAGYVELVASNKTGGMGSGGTTPLGVSIQNNLYIDTDNTPIYLYLVVNISGGTTWGVPIGTNQYNDHMNYVMITRS